MPTTTTSTATLPFEMLSVTVDRCGYSDPEQMLKAAKEELARAGEGRFFFKERNALFGVKQEIGFRRTYVAIPNETMAVFFVPTNFSALYFWLEGPNNTTAVLEVQFRDIPF